ncbi:MAG: hypothetical protein QF521_04855 [Alphaproteobacteria bacterium]|jgi:TRAP-type C4-dicarboxylate transport system permease small subunit|nr:hypothetical protein [Alphaproteobacteria bacterium]MDP6872834.1 hypothetical protein [Alphaproteobacteria bacterium]
MKWWGPVGLIAGVVLTWFGYDICMRALHIGWSHHLPQLMVGVACFLSGPFVAVVALVNARRFGRS